MPVQILVIEENQDVFKLLNNRLKSDDYKLLLAENKREVISQLQQKPDFIFLRNSSARLDVFDICSEIRKENPINKIPIVMISEMENEAEELLAFSLGINDFLVKPLTFSKLIARVNLWRKLGKNKIHFDSRETTKSPIKIDEEKLLVFIDEKKVNFSKKEFELLNFFVKNPNIVFNRDALYKNIWGENVYLSSRTIDVHIRSIRKKLGSRKNLLETKRGFGYKLCI